MVIELRVVQFWSEIILVISNQTRAARSFDFEITRIISDQITLHLVQLPLYIFKSWDRLHIEDEQQYSPLVQVVKLKIQRVRVVRVVKLCEWFKW